jgi:Fe-S-cluster containining protein
MVELRVGGRKASLQAILPRGEVPLAALIPFTQRLSGTLTEWAEQDVAAKRQAISCRPGCAACCRLSVTVSAAEARRLAALVDSLAEPRRSEVRRRFAEGLRKLGGTDLLARWTALSALERDDPVRAAAGFDEWALAYFRLAIPRPFLAAEACSIYADRPLICREYLVTTPAARCSAVGRRGWREIERIPLYASVAGAFDAMGREKPARDSRSP